MKRLMIFAALVALLASCSHRLVIVHTNDTHSHFEPLRETDDESPKMGGVIEQAAYIDSVRHADGKRNVLLLHAGDFNQGTSYFTIFKGDLEIGMLNAMKYDCVTLGNHEFDNGLDDLARRLSELHCPVVCANYDFFINPKLKSIVKPYVILKRGGHKIGIIGMLCDISRVVDGNISKKLPRLDEAETANKWASYLKNEEGCDLVIVLSHMGFNEDRNFVKTVRNIDLVIGGHSHTLLKQIEYSKDLDGREVPIVQDGGWGLYLGHLEIK